MKSEIYLMKKPRNWKRTIKRNFTKTSFGIQMSSNDFIFFINSFLVALTTSHKIILFHFLILTTASSKLIMKFLQHYIFFLLEANISYLVVVTSWLLIRNWKDFESFNLKIERRVTTTKNHYLRSYETKNCQVNIIFV